LLKCCFAFQLQLRRITPDRAQKLFCVFRGTELRLSVGDVSWFAASDQQDGPAAGSEIDSDGLVYVVQHTDNPEHRCGINAFAQSLVVKADISTCDRDFELLAGLSQSVDNLRELPHNVSFFRIAEVEAVGCRDRRRAGTSDVACRLGHCMHGTEAWVEIAPTAVAIQRHGQPSLRAFDANDSRIPGTRALHSVGLYHGVVLLPHPAFPADIPAGQHFLEVGGQVGYLAQADVLRLLARNWWLPALQRTLVDGGIVSQSFVRNLGHDFAVLQDAHLPVGGHATDFDSIQAPRFEDAKDLLFTAFLG